MLITLLRLIFTSKFFCFSYILTRGRGLIGRYFGMRRMIRTSDRHHRGERFDSHLKLWNLFICSFTRCQVTIQCIAFSQELKREMVAKFWLSNPANSENLNLTGKCNKKMGISSRELISFYRHIVYSGGLKHIYPLRTNSIVLFVKSWIC